jgi:hypothetical protein
LVTPKLDFSNIGKIDTINSLALHYVRSAAVKAHVIHIGTIKVDDGSPVERQAELKELLSSHYSTLRLMTLHIPEHPLL